MFQNVTASTTLSSTSHNTALYVSERPGLKEFLTKMAKIYTLILFTSAIEEYAHAILKLLKIDKFFFQVLHRAHCKKNDVNTMKDLSILGLHMRDVILVDDSAAHIMYQPNNILLIHPYKGDPADRELYFISKFLAKLAKEEDVRPVMNSFIKFDAASRDYITDTQADQRAETVNKYYNIMFLQNLKSPSSIKVETCYDINDENLNECEFEKKLSNVSTQKMRLMDSLKSNTPSNSDKIPQITNTEESISTDDTSPDKLNQYKRQNFKDFTEQITLAFEFTPSNIPGCREVRANTDEPSPVGEGDATPRSTPDKLPIMTLPPKLLEERKRID